MRRQIAYGALLGLSGCCTEADCASQITLSLSPIAAGETLTVDVSVVHDDGSRSSTRCDADLIAGDATCDGGTTLRLQGDRWELQTPNYGGEADVDAEVAVDGAVLWSGPADVAWGTPFYPNGPTCEPGCVGGRGEVSW